ncbi:M13 family metallopeptidase [Dyadobacter sp. NIV53]|uniref:M13 family metallopeptidase n=1 Tax=Dyadobacter sp. NIV53 TaxID=2861765 RepID=UPI001C86946D|nr:M13 family metallopeptidase [Dyadobacter sp. NIV53]
MKKQLLTHSIQQVFSIGLCLLACTACQQKKNSETPVRTMFFDKSDMDTTVLPGNDFFAYANGTWLKKTVIPANQIRWGTGTQLADENRQKTKAILEQAARSNPNSGRTEQLVGDFYSSGMDTVAINQLGFSPLKAGLANIAAISDYRQLIDHLITDESDVTGFWTASNSFIGFYVGPDDRQSTNNCINFQQAGLSLPEKGYYTRTDEATKKIRQAFLDYVTKLFTLTGIEPALAHTKATAILAFETKLAQSHKEQADLRDPVANYHKFNVTDLIRKMPNLNWRRLLNAKKLQRVDTVLVAQPAYYQALDKLLPSTPVSVLKDRLLFDLLDYNAPLLSQEFEQASFEFNQKALLGQVRLPDRWKRLVILTDAELGDALGQLWVKQYFPPEARQRMLKLVDNLQGVYRERIEALDWMTPETKAIALIKLDKFTKKIGYPDKWNDYSGVVIKRDDYYGNVQRTRRYRTESNLAKINHPVDRTEWGMTPPTVNAYANPWNNEIVFPAGILQFPFFDKDVDEAINYGGIGTVIGHEMTHLFDDQGRKYDANGNLRDWWTKNDAERFELKAKVVEKQYNTYTLLDGLTVNGQLTLGENLADLGGITLSYEAFKRTQQGQGTTKIDGFSPDERFFLSYARIWRNKVRDATQRARLLTDPHSPARFRVNGPLTNFEPFYRVFNVKPGQKLYRPQADQARVW